MSNRRKKRRPNGKPSGGQRPRQERSVRPPRIPKFPQELDHEMYRMMGLSTALGTGIAHKAVEILDRYWDRLEIRGISADGSMAYVTLDVPQPDGAVLTTILDIARDFKVVSKSADPERRTWDAIVQLGKLDAMVTRLTAAV
jgi:hypothetical protein